MKPYLQELEDEAIFIIREAASTIEKLVMLYSIGKDSSVMLHLAEKAFAPAPIPFPLMHIDTGFKFPEMYKMRDEISKKHNLIIERNEEWISKNCNPKDLGCDVCCQHLKTDALLNALNKHGFVAAFGGSRRDEEASRRKEKIFSVRTNHKWEPKSQRPELWNLYNTMVRPNQSLRIFPISNFTELDVWDYILEENIPILDLYFSKLRNMKSIQGTLIADQSGELVKERYNCRFRSLGCVQCSGAVESNVQNVEDIIEELKDIRKSERQFRLIDKTSLNSLQRKKESGYF